MPEITFQGHHIKTFKVSGIITFITEVKTEIKVDVNRKDESNWDFASQAKLALIEEAKKQVQLGNCEAKISNADIHL